MTDQEKPHIHKVGDRVRLVRTLHGLPTNTMGEVTAINGPEEQWPLTVDWDGLDWAKGWFVAPSEIEPA